MPLNPDCGVRAFVTGVRRTVRIHPHPGIDFAPEPSAFAGQKPGPAFSASSSAANSVRATRPSNSGFWWATAVLTLTQLLMVFGVHAAARAEGDRTAVSERFDQIVIPAVEKSLRQPVTQQGGELAWGESYQLDALAEMFAATHDPKYAELIVRLSDWMVKSRDDQQNLRDEFRDRVVAAWGSTNYSKGKRYVWAVHTGMIVAPMARFAAVVRSEPKLKARWDQDAERLLKIAGEAVAVHDADYREGPGADEGYLYSLFLKKHLPLNMQNALARAWLAIDDATGTPKYRERATRLAQFLKNRLRPIDDGAYVWAYWPPLDGPGDSFEDISHAAINVDFMVRCYEHNLVFRSEDLARLGKTLLTRVLVADDRISDTVGGGEKFNTYRSAGLRWGRLARHSATVRERLGQLSQLPEFARDVTSLPLAMVYLNLPAPTAGEPVTK